MAHTPYVRHETDYCPRSHPHKATSEGATGWHMPRPDETGLPTPIPPPTTAGVQIRDRPVARATGGKWPQNRKWTTPNR